MVLLFSLIAGCCIPGGDAPSEPVAPRVTVYEGQGRRVAALHLEVQTGDEYLCGGHDLQVEGVALVDLSTMRAILEPTPVFAAHIIAVVDLDLDGTPEVLVRHFPSTTTAIRADGEAACETGWDFCDCSC